MPTSAPSSPAASSFTQGLLSSLQPWLTGASPSALSTTFAPDGGIQGLLAALEQGSGPDTTQARTGAALQRAQALALQEAHQRQQMAAQQINLQRQAMMLPFMQAYFGAAMGGGNGAGATPNPAANSRPAPGAGSAQPSGFGGTAASAQTAAPTAAPAALGASPPPGPPAAPIMGPFSPLHTPAKLGTPPINATPVSVTGPAAGAPPGGTAPINLSQFAPPTPSQISSIPIGGMPARFYRLGALLSGGNPLTTATQIRAEQLKVAQQQYGPVLAELDTLDKAQSPTQYVQASPQLMAEWHQLAPALGFDPAKGFTNANVRTAFSFLRNKLAGALTLPTVAAPVQMATVNGPLGSIFQRNPVTHALSQVKPEEALKAVVGPNGNIRYVPASAATGQTPFNDMTYVNPQTTDALAKEIADYSVAPLSGFALRTPQGQAVMAAVQKFNPHYDATTYQTKQVAREAFATGKQGNIVRSLSVATNHLDQLGEAAHALAQHDMPAVNSIVNMYARHTGNSSITTFNAMKEIVGDEVVKAVVGTGGAESDRQAIKDAFNAANSPKQLEGVINHYEGLMAGQLNGLRRQYQRATGLKDFNTFVSQLAERKLTAAGAADSGAGPAPLGIGQSTKLGQFTVTRVK